MDTSILHTRIEEYKSKAKNPISKEMILLFESWFGAIENYLSDVELDNIQLNYKIQHQEEIINLLIDIIIITGNADKLLFDPTNKYTRDAISLLLKSNDRVNHDSLNAISTLLYINPDKKFENLKQLKEYATGQ